VSLTLEAPEHLFAFVYQRAGQRVDLIAETEREVAIIIHVGSQNDAQLPLSPIATYLRHDLSLTRVAEAVRERDAFRDRVDALNATLHKLRMMGLSCGENGEERMPQAAIELVANAEAHDAYLSGQMADDGYNFGRSTR
jgi:hypothetical protein